MERKAVTYACEGHDPLIVEYLNAAPNFLALLPVGDQTLIFVNVISASGAKYESGSYVWWTKGADATLHDVTEGLDAAPVLTCSEQVDTP
ncbi:MAG: MliC family protein [Devosia nanyangense]|uniref:MliC family protein n=1 Tax=Devosia nanyangense TaxID=1228055 RepID=A0A933L130_9HYPH|nr:MliC family protein [Devosia nanyangense]